MLQQYGKGPEGMQQLKHIASAFAASNRGFDRDTEDIPNLVENFESKLTADDTATGTKEVNIDEAAASSSKELVD